MADERHVADAIRGLVHACLLSFDRPEAEFTGLRCEAAHRRDPLAEAA
jgi:hypothetical protein